MESPRPTGGLAKMDNKSTTHKSHMLEVLLGMLLLLLSHFSRV